MVSNFLGYMIGGRQKSLRMNPIGGAKDHVGVLVQGCFHPQVCTCTCDLHVSQAGKLDKGLIHCAEHGDALSSLFWQWFSIEGPRPGVPSDLEPGVLGFDFVDPFLVGGKWHVDEENILTGRCAVGCWCSV